MEKEKLLLKKKDRSGLMSLIFLLIIFFSTVGLYFYNGKLEQKNIKLKTNIATLEKEIKEIEKDRNFQVYDLIQKNSIVLNELNQKSQIVDFINHMNLLRAKYSLEFSGFDYSSGKLTTSVISSIDGRKRAYEKVSNFIRDYRKSENRKFDLGFIESISGQDEIEFEISLDLIIK